MAICHFVISAILYLNLSGISKSIDPQQSSTMEIDSEKKTEPSTVSYCDLVTHPELYENKTVRVDATYFVGRHSAILYDKACSYEGSNIYFALDCNSKTKCKKLNDKIRKDLTGKLKWARVQLVVIGRFNGPQKSGVNYGAQVGPDSGYKFQLDVSKIEKTTRIPIDEPLE